MTLESYTIYPSNIDNRVVKCACGDNKCKIGVNADENILLLIDKYGNYHAMHIDEKNRKELIELIKSF